MERLANERGTSGSRRRPQRHTDGSSALAYLDSDGLETALDLRAAITRTAGTANDRRYKWDYSDPMPAYSEDDVFTIQIDGDLHIVRVVAKPFIQTVRWWLHVEFVDIPGQPWIDISAQQFARLIVPTLAIVPRAEQRVQANVPTLVKPIALLCAVNPRPCVDGVLIIEEDHGAGPIGFDGELIWRAVRPPFAVEHQEIPF